MIDDRAAGDRIVNEQVAYYRARASEYDEWFLRQGRYDRGEQHRAEWFAEIEEIRAALGQAIQGGEVLELACGTGLWTHLLAATNAHVVAVDSSPEAISLNKAGARSGNIEYVIADLFSWKPARAFDAVFFSFWLSHVPPARFSAFWDTVRSALKPGGCAFFVDSLLEQTSTAVDHHPLDSSGVVTRKLNDGREFQIVKVFYDPAGLDERLRRDGWSGWVRSTNTFFLYGAVTPHAR